MRRFAAAAALASLAILATAQPGLKSVSDLKGKSMPSWSMKTTAGKTLSSSTTKGKVVLLDFWASWCGPCKAASPTMESLHKAHSSKGLIVVGSNGLENKKGPSFAKDYQKKHGYGYTFSYDNDALMDKLKIEGVPTFILIDKKGRVSFVATQWTDKVKADLTKAVQAAIKG